jgi:hypothetical protein
MAVAPERENEPCVSQMVASVPAFTRACLEMLRVMVSVTVVQGEALAAARVRVTDPAAISARPGV